MVSSVHQSGHWHLPQKHQGSQSQTWGQKHTQYYRRSEIHDTITARSDTISTNLSSFIVNLTLHWLPSSHAKVSSIVFLSKSDERYWEFQLFIISWREGKQSNELTFLPPANSSRQPMKESRASPDTVMPPLRAEGGWRHSEVFLISSWSHLSNIPVSVTVWILYTNHSVTNMDI